MESPGAEAGSEAAAGPALSGGWIGVAVASLVLGGVLAYLVPATAPAVSANELSTPLWALADVPAMWLRANGGLLALLWLGAAAGCGTVVRPILFPALVASDARRAPLTLALGVATLLALDSLLASVGAFGVGRAWLAVLVLLIGVMLAGRSAWHAARQMDLPSVARTLLRASWRPGFAWLALPALGALVVAAAAPPGLLWSTEFGGYDALSYHLQVPREWLELGAALPLQHNVYSAFPGFVESATLHLFAAAQWDDVRAAASAVQMLHALLAVCAAWITGAVAATCARTPPAATVARAVAWCFVLGVPWVLVTGTLAYDEMAMLVCMAGAMLAWQCADGCGKGAPRVGVALGLLLGAAVGSKLTALGAVVVPVVLWTLLAPAASGTRERWSRWRALVPVGAIAAGTACVVLLPWLVRTAVVTGNPVFPFAANIFGNGWWTADQVARFARGHAAAGGILARLHEFWVQGPVFGLGAAPALKDEWMPQWSVAWWVAAGAGLYLGWRQRDRVGLAAGAMITAQLLFWLLATHMKSRFLLPCVVPMGVLVGAAAAGAAVGGSAVRSRAPLLAVLVLWCAQPAAMLWFDARTRSGLAAAALGGYDAVQVGGGPRELGRHIPESGRKLPFAWTTNYTLPLDARIATVGEAAVFWCARTPAYGTVWDGGPLVAALRVHGDDPNATIRALVDAGYTHLAVNDLMLDIWTRSGWLDPALTPGRLASVIARLKPIRNVLPSGSVYRLPPR